MYIFLLIMIFIIIFIILNALKKAEKKVMNLTINTLKPKKLKPLKKEILLEPMDLNYYNRLNQARLELKNSRKKNYRMNKETINNEIAELPDNTILQNVELRLPENINLNNFNNDNQNVHDTTIQDTIKKKYQILKKKNNNNLNNLNKLFNLNKKHNLKIEDILNYAKKNNNLKNEERLKFILEQIYERNSSIINLDYSTEVEILNMIWSNSDIRDQIINELFECYDPIYKNIVCPTGVVSRLLNADIILNPESSPRTIEMLREEMLNIASKIRSDCENDEEYKKLNEDDQSKNLKEKIINKIHETYINIISEDKIQKELDTWIEHI